MRNPNRTIVTLCGSTRFADAYIKAQRDETLKGNIVISVGLFGHQEEMDMKGEIKKDLDDLHLDKIDLSHEILVINPKCHVCDKCGKPCDTETLYFHSNGYKTLSKCCCYQWEYRPYIGESTAREIDYARSTGKKVRYLNEEKV